MAQAHDAKDEAKFYLKHAVSMVGYEDALEIAIADTPTVPNAAGVSSKEEAIENLSISFHTGIEEVMQNRRELGHHPVNAFEFVVDESWPEFVKSQIAESQYDIFGGRSRDPEFVTEEEDEYLTFLEEEYDVPR